MTTEEDFQRALDADPENGGLRMVFADYLDEQGDPRGPGYRALGLLGLNGSNNILSAFVPLWRCKWWSPAESHLVNDRPWKILP